LENFFLLIIIIKKKFEAEIFRGKHGCSLRYKSINYYDNNTLHV